MYDKGSAFMNEEFTSWTHELGITHPPRTAYSPGPTEKLRSKTNILAHISESFLNKLIVIGVT